MKDAVFFYASFGASYEGNFIPSLRMLNEDLKAQGIVSVLFLPKEVRHNDWITRLCWCEEVVFFDGNFAKDAPLIASVIKRYNVRFIHTHFAESKHILALKLAMLLAAKQIPIVEHQHTQFPVPKNPLKRTLKFAILRNNYMLGCGKSVAEGLASSGIRNPVDYVDNALDFERLKNSGHAPKGQTLLMFGYNSHIKGVDLAMLACRELIKEFPNLRLQVCVAVNMDAARNSAVELLGSIPDWLQFLPPTQTIADYYRNATVFLSPSRQEGLCYSVIEAAYCGCAVIGSDIDGIHDIKLPSMKLIPRENVRALAESIREILEMSGTDYQHLTENLHNEAVESYQLERWSEEMMAYLRRNNLIS